MRRERSILTVWRRFVLLFVGVRWGRIVAGGGGRRVARRGSGGGRRRGWGRTARRGRRCAGRGRGGCRRGRSGLCSADGGIRGGGCRRGRVLGGCGRDGR